MFANPELAPAPAARVRLRTLSLDLETTPDASRIFAAALVGCGVEEVHLVAPRAVGGRDRASRRAGAALPRSSHACAALDPDVLLGWNVVDFDLRVLLARCTALRIPCAIGRSREPPRLHRRPGRSRASRAPTSPGAWCSTASRSCATR